MASLASKGLKFNDCIEALSPVLSKILPIVPAYYPLCPNSCWHIGLGLGLTEVRVAEH